MGGFEVEYVGLLNRRLGVGTGPEIDRWLCSVRLGRAAKIESGLGSPFDFGLVDGTYDRENGTT